MNSQIIKKLERIMLIFLSLFYAGGISRDIIMEEYNIGDVKTIQRYERTLNSCFIDELKISTHVVKNSDCYIDSHNIPEITWNFDELNTLSGIDLLKPSPSEANQTSTALHQLLIFFFSFEDFFLPYFIEDIDECNPEVLDSNAKPIVLNPALVETKFSQLVSNLEIDEYLIKDFLNIIYSAIATGNKYNLFDGISLN